MPDDLMSLYDIAVKFHKSPECIRLWITRGILIDGDRKRLKGVKVGGTWCVSEADLHQWVFKALQPKVEA